jgi:hypothetical protein
LECFPGRRRREYEKVRIYLEAELDGKCQERWGISGHFDGMGGWLRNWWCWQWTTQGDEDAME